LSSGFIDGAALASTILEDVATGVAAFHQQTGRPPQLVTVLVGDDHASQVYVRMKVNRAHGVGMLARSVELPAGTTTAELLQTLSELSADPEVDGILLQHPAAPPVDERTALEAITPEKDVDGLTRESLARAALGEPGFRAATPGGIMRLLDAYEVQIAGAETVVIGCSAILGLPVGLLLLARGATVTYCHLRTRDLPAAVRRADILVAAAGSPELVKGDWIKPGAVVIDAGYSPGGIGDVEFDTARQRACLITPVPGGVGPMTIAVLLEQTLTAARSRAGAI